MLNGVIGSANQVQVGVKSASALNILASTVFFQADGCGYNPSGTTAFTQRNITVIRFTQDGMPVKSTVVPDVEAFAVSDVSTLLPIEETTAPVIVGLVNVLPVSVWVAARPTSVSVTAGSVRVLVPATAGAVSVTDPDVDPLSATGIRQSPK